MILFSLVLCFVNVFLARFKFVFSCVKLFFKPFRCPYGCIRLCLKSLILLSLKTFVSSYSMSFAFTLLDLSEHFLEKLNYKAA